MNEVLLGVFFEDVKVGESKYVEDYLYVSFNGRTFYKIDEPFRSFRDPGMMYYKDRYWILGGDVSKSAGNEPNRYQLKWKVSGERKPQNWSNALTGSGTNNPISLDCMMSAI